MLFGMHLGLACSGFHVRKPRGPRPRTRASRTQSAPRADPAVLQHLWHVQEIQREWLSEAVR